jgi:predicted RNA-binding protein with PUA-like domain
MAMLILKTEAGDYSFGDLVREKRTVWSGVSNPAALANLRGAKKGDDILVYHTGDEKRIVGLARVVKEASEDPKQPGTNDRGEPKFAVIEIAAVRAVPRPVTLAEIKAEPMLANLALVRQGRLSVVPVSAAEEKVLRAMLGI